MVESEIHLAVMTMMMMVTEMIRMLMIMLMMMLMLFTCARRKMETTCSSHVSCGVVMLLTVMVVECGVVCGVAPSRGSRPWWE